MRSVETTLRIDRRRLNGRSALPEQVRSYAIAIRVQSVNLPIEILRHIRRYGARFYASYVTASILNLSHPRCKRKQQVDLDFHYFIRQYTQRYDTVGDGGKRNGP